MRIQTPALTFALALPLLAALPHRADAHAHLEQSSPPAGAQIASPDELRLHFNEPIEAKFSRVGLAGASGAAVQTGPASIDAADGTTLLVPIPAALAPGRYTVKWRAVGRDTHAVTGEFQFDVLP